VDSLRRAHLEIPLRGDDIGESFSGQRSKKCSWRHLRLGVRQRDDRRQWHFLLKHASGTDRHEFALLGLVTETPTDWIAGAISLCQNFYIREVADNSK